MVKRPQHQPYRKGQPRLPGPALTAMQRGAPATGHPSALKRAFMRKTGAAKRPHTMLQQSLARHGRK